ncbi:MAG: ATP-binding protein [Undibacterium umbellatum]|uniref:ATP-binding protein n=1 Tax=Undibacterium TaxID=401469 RepID=UPI00272F2EE4|nr:ATP-binding protein [Undibacterium sp.]MDP1979851.1 ATP-binding protein [Undibacterium sp.]
MLKLGRLFWKFFFFIWLAQLTAIAGISITFWIKHSNEELARSAATSMNASKLVEEGRYGPGPGRVFHHGEGPGKPPGDFAPPAMGKRKPPPDNGGMRTLIPMTCALLASLLFAALMAWYMSKPIRRLSEAFQALAGGKLHARIGDSMGQRKDELTELGRDFDRMAEQLTGALQNQRRLLHDVSHELRSPLARLQAAIGLARQQPDKAEEYMVRMDREAVRMDKLVGEILTLSRLEAGAQAGQDLIYMDELFAELTDNAQFEASNAGKVFKVAFSADEISKTCVRGSYELLHRALENVLRNAIRHTAPDTAVSLQAHVKQGQLHIQVLDEGSGVPEAELQSIFQPFYRSVLAEHTGDGYGLGLAITQRVILAHAGSITASNRQPAGLCMQMTLPVAFA